ncbi:unnamed protein product [marine sediment metagenome]|uniref:Uncharacterized protein n=1 Tax=marine sediment metagenome TaxID=412755 RepID=X1NQ44_9ZZZZ
MPYISRNNDRREKLRNGEPALLAGELNYQIFYYVKHNKSLNSSKIKKYIDQFLTKKPSYQKYNDMTGVLIRCYKEIERRLDRDVYDLFIDIMELYDEEINSYEDKKIKENSDVE